MGNQKKSNHVNAASGIGNFFGDGAVKNTAPPTGEQTFIEINGVVHEYYHEERYDRAIRFSKILESEIDWIERFVKHAPSIGSHYESILRDLLEDYLPSSLKVGTGFVYDLMRNECSTQIDIIVYSDSKKSPIHRRGEFVVVDAESVVSVCEVKKELNVTALGSYIKRTVGLNLGCCPKYPFGVQRLGIFAYKCRIPSKNIIQRMLRELDNYFSQFVGKTRGGHKAYLPMHQLVLPNIYLHDRGEYISSRLVRDGSGSIATVAVSLHTCPDGKCIGPLLFYMNPIGEESPMRRDLLSGFFERRPSVEIDRQADNKISLMRKISSADLVERFTDAKEILSKGYENGEFRYGAYISSFEDLSAFSTLDELTHTDGFTWQIVKSK